MNLRTISSKALGREEPDGQAGRSIEGKSSYGRMIDLAPLGVLPEFSH